MNPFTQTISLAALMTTSIPLGVSAMPNLIAQQSSPQYQLQRKQEETKTRPVAGSIVLVQPCPDGQKRIIWEQPIYDDDELFVIGHKNVPICVPENATPAG